MTSVSAADTWWSPSGENAVRSERPGAARSGRPGGERRARPLPPLPPLPSQGRPAPGAARSAHSDPRPGAGRTLARSSSGAERSESRSSYDQPVPGYPRSSASLSAQGHSRHPGFDASSDRSDDDRRPSARYDDDRRPAAREEDDRSRGRTAPQPERGSRLRGSLAVLGVLLVSLGAGFLDTLGTPKLGTITLVGLTAASALGTLLVRRRDLVTTVIAPPLVLVVVIAVHIVTAAGFAVPEGGSLLKTVLTGVGAELALGAGFPTMAVATGTSLVLALVRWAARR